MKRPLHRLMIWLCVLALAGTPCRGETADRLHGGDMEDIAWRVTGCDDFHAELEAFYQHYTALLGQKVLIEGYLYAGDAPELERARYYYVYHWTDNCCGEGLVQEGMEVVWLNDDGAYPEQGAYVRAVGILRIYEDHDRRLLRLELTSLEQIEDACGDSSDHDAPS